MCERAGGKNSIMVVEFREFLNYVVWQSDDISSMYINVRLIFYKYFLIGRKMFPVKQTKNL